MGFNWKTVSVLVLLFGLVGIAFPKTQSSDQDQSVKSDVKDAGRSTKRATRNVAKLLQNIRGKARTVVHYFDADILIIPARQQLHFGIGEIGGVLDNIA